MSEEGVQHINNTIYKQNALSALNDVRSYFARLLSILPDTSESLRNYEAKFAAQIAQLIAHGEFIKMHESLRVMTFLSASKIGDTQSVPVL